MRFEPGPAGARPSTRVEIVVKLPLPPLIGPLVKPLLEAAIRREVRAAAAEDQTDIEQRGYPRSGFTPPYPEPR